jgi:transcriptional regulator GlxA family with amidase domain
MVREIQAVPAARHRGAQDIAGRSSGTDGALLPTRRREAVPIVTHSHRSRIPLRELPIWILEHLSEDLSVEHLAQRAAMSVRNFSRAFTAEYGVTPARFVERLRVETAERLMQDSDKSVKEIAAECGFGSPDTLRRALKRGGKTIPPQLYDQTIPIRVQH